MPDDLGAFEVLPEGVVVLEADLAIRWASQRGRLLLGLADDAIGEHVDDVLVLHTEGGDRCRVSGFLDGHGDRISERLLDAQVSVSRRRTVAVTGTRLADGYVLTVRHAGRRKQLDAARSDLVATVSHEIRSPLTSVKGFTRTLLGKWERFSDEQKRTMLETINEDADRVTRLLTELLDVSRIDANRVQLRKVGVDLAEVVTGVVERAKVKPDAAERDVVAQVVAVPKTLCDRDKVEQVLHNLVENALNYGEGTITVTAAVDGDAVVTSVADEGPGIAEDQARSIFEKFGRGREVRRAGTGLGLYISRGLVRAHGGDLTLASSPSGSTFTATWPVTTSPD